jgi:uncharacterized transporter YbjL
MDLTVKSPDPDHKPKREKTKGVQTSATPMATIHDDDELLLARIGYKQVFAPNALVKIIAGQDLIVIYTY